MNILSRKLIGKLIIESGEKIRDGKCGLDDEELLEIGKLVLHRKLNIEQTCSEYGMSRATLSRKVSSGEFPKPHKDPGGKEYFWQDEIETKINGLG